MRRPTPLFGSVVTALLLVATACTTTADPVSTSVTPGPATTSSSSTTTSVPPMTIDPNSHTVPTLRSIADFDQLAKTGVGGQSVVKFAITEFATDPQLEWLDGNFYTLHDEWYWFQLLNGEAVRGFDTEPVPSLAGRSGRLASIDEAYEWAEQQRTNLPLDLRFTSLDRLYSPRFYDEALTDGEPRRIGLGALIRIPDPNGAADRWVIELEYSDPATTGDIDAFLDIVGRAGPPEVADNLTWVPRSRAQELIADAIEAGSGPNADRIVRYSELSTPGDVEVYSPAIAAGRLLVVTDEGRWSLSDAGPNDIVAIDRAPDDLPPGNGLITGTPQTPLAHVNVLALNRGIPNAFLAGLADNPTIAQLGRVRAPVLVQTTTDGLLDIIPLTDEEYEGWLAAQGKNPISVRQIDPTALPYTETIASLTTRVTSAAELEAWRPIIGGKAAGFIELALVQTTMPPDATVITIRPYIEHMAQFDDVVDAIIDDDDLDSIRSRALVLEGRSAFDERFPSVRDAEFADEFARTHPPGSPLGDALAAGGLVELISATPMSEESLAAIAADLSANYADYAPDQGLRFRSSSTVEDIEGFNGAGLYESNTGYLDPTALADADDHKRTIERAILKTWGSYWGSKPFEERERENIDHRSGAMAVLVHARFDDELERSNGVATYTINPDPATAAVMTINAQTGSTSVTNPETGDGAAPEVIEVRIAEPTSRPTIERLASSGLTDVVLDDDQVLQLFAQTRAVADSWLMRANAELPSAQQSSTLTLDIEFRQMAPGWPARVAGRPEPERLIIKQARTLDPGMRKIPAEVIALPIPRDVLASALAIVELTCPSAGQVGVRVVADPFARVEFQDGEEPFEIWASGADLAGLTTAETITNEPPLEVTDCTERDLVVSPRSYLLDLLETR